MGARVKAYDPIANHACREQRSDLKIRLCDTVLELASETDALVLVTEWPEFRELDWAGEVKRRMRVPLVVDGRNFLDREQLVEAGFTYEGIGR